MDKDKFWEIIHNAKILAGEWQIMKKPLTQELSKLKTIEIMHWNKILNQYLQHANKAKLFAAAAIILNGCSDDSFAYFRGWIIAQGKTTYLHTVSDPDSLAENTAIQKYADEISCTPYKPTRGYSQTPLFEDILYTACNIYVKKSGKEIKDFYNLYDSIPIIKKEKENISKELGQTDDLHWNDVIDLAHLKYKVWLPQLYKRFYGRS